MNPVIQLAKQTYRASDGENIKKDLLLLLSLIKFAQLEEQQRPLLPGTEIALINQSLYVIRSAEETEEGNLLEGKLLRVAKSVLQDLKLELLSAGNSINF